jgi:5-methylcytosine-specific restriction endonuclease McrA
VSYVTQISTCSIVGCERPVYVRGYCALHYNRIMKGNPDMRPQKIREYTHPEKCTYPGCNKDYYSLGYCIMHYTRLDEHGRLGGTDSTVHPYKQGDLISRCNYCGLDLPISFFSKKLNGLSSYCRTCFSLSRADYRKSGKGREISRKNGKKWGMTENGKAHIHVARNNRRAKILNSGGDITIEDRAALLLVYENKCIYCGKELSRPTLDHFIPIALGGTNTIDNIVPACINCNSRKWALSPQYYLGERYEEIANHKKEMYEQIRNNKVCG